MHITITMMHCCLGGIIASLDSLVLHALFVAATFGDTVLHFI